MNIIQRFNEVYRKAMGKNRQAKVFREKNLPTKRDPLIDVAEDLDCEVDLIKAFLQVESGKHHKYQGRLVINYEAHYFKRLTGQVVPDRNIIKGDRLNQEDEYRNFKKAISINEEAAHKSISMGMSQIMGANHNILGYKSAVDMFDAFQESKDNAIYGFGAFVKSNKRLHKACKEFDYHHMAYYYNGSKYQKYVDRNGKTYADKIRETYAKLSGAA